MEPTICTECEWFVHNKCVSPNAPITDFIQGTKSLLENAEGKCRYYQERSSIGRQWTEERLFRFETMAVVRENPMKIDCYLSQGCGSEEALRENVTQALVIEKVKAEINFHKIDDEKAIALGLSGSPSVFVDGKEIQPQRTAGFS